MTPPTTPADQPPSPPVPTADLAALHDGLIRLRVLVESIDAELTDLEAWATRHAATLRDLTGEPITFPLSPEQETEA